MKNINGENKKGEKTMRYEDDDLKDYDKINIPDEVEEKINMLSERLDTQLNKMQWNRIHSLLTSLHFYIDLYKEEIIKNR